MQILSHENYQRGLTSEKRYFLGKIFSTELARAFRSEKVQALLNQLQGMSLGPHSSTQALFPVNLPCLKGKGKENPCLLAKPLGKNVRQASKGAVKEVTKKIYSQLNTVYKKWAGETFAQAPCNIPKAEVEKTKTNLEKKQEQRNIKRQGKRARHFLCKVRRQPKQTPLFSSQCITTKF